MTTNKEIMKNKIILLMIVGQLALFTGVDAQSVAINTSGATADVSAILDITSTTKGVLVPRLTTALIGSIATPANGLMVYNTTTNSLNVNTGSTTVPTFVSLLSNITATAPLTYTTGSLAIPVATTSVNGYLAATDWTIFNAKQPLISNPNSLIGFVKANGTTISYDQSVYLTTISGTANYLPKFATASTFSGTSLVYDNGSAVGINLSAPATLAANSTLQVSGSFSTPVGSYTSTSVTAAWNTASLVLITSSSTVTLPTAVGIAGRIYTIKNVTSPTATFNLVPFVATTLQTIDGVASFPLTATYKFVTVQSDGANWYVLGNN